MVRPPRTRQPATYQDIIDLPERITGEILGGELHTRPRPSGRHVLVASTLGGQLSGPFGFGKSGPGGWWILHEPELHLQGHVLVPDLAGGRRERLPRIPDDQRFTVVPDWVCEVLSPGTARRDRSRKLPLYGDLGVAHLWLVDPAIRTVEIFILQEGSWSVAAVHAEAESICAPPFEAVAVELAYLWDTGDTGEAQEP